jgi:hypothetical protein
MPNAIRLFAIPILVLSTAAACTRAGAKEPPKPPPPDPKLVLDEHARLAAPIQVESLQLTPIISTDNPVPSDDLMVLDEAMEKKLVEIKEVGGGSVNQLELSNKSTKPLFLLAGEVIIGGRQDRIIGSNTIIPANSDQTVPVFCVEHGRWQGETGQFTSAHALAHGRLRGQANYKGQQDVWDEVEAKNTVRGTQTATGTYRHVAQQESNGSQKSWDDRIADALAKVAPDDRARMIGFAVSLNGKVATIDRFGSPQLFGKLRDKLVHSYIIEAVDVPAVANATHPDAAAIRAFIAEAEKPAATASYETDLASSELKKGEKAAKAKVMYKPAKGGGKMDKSAPPATVYQNYQTME